MSKELNKKETTIRLIHEVRFESRELDREFPKLTSKEVKSKIETLKEKINDLEENLTRNKNYVSSNIEEDMFDFKLKRRILIKNKNKSESFIKWLFNNLDL